MNAPEFGIAVVGHEGSYEVSRDGHVRSLDKRVKTKWGTRFVAGRVLKPESSVTGHQRVHLYSEGKSTRELVHRIVAEAYIPNPDNLPLVLHWDDDAGNNRVENLRWGTHSDNGFDSVRNGNHPESRKTICPANHPYTENNTYVNAKGFRRCLTCRLLRRVKGLPPGDPRHGTPNGFSNYGCRCPECTLIGGYSRKGKVSDKS